MKNQLKFTLDITFLEGDMTRLEKNRVAQNILNALLYQYNTEGLMPDESDFVTESITVTAPDDAGEIRKETYLC